MYTDFFNEFLESGDTLRVYEEDKLIFSSNKDRLLPLLEYIEKFVHREQPVVIFDKIMGNAAALLSVKVGCREVYSPLGSELAVSTLKKYDVRYHLSKLSPYILRPDGEMCPMERLSMGKEPDEFYEAIKAFLRD